MDHTEALVLEPDQEARKQIDQALRSFPLTTVTPGDLSEALNRAAESPVALVIADFDMLSGTRRLREPARSTDRLREAILRFRQSEERRPPRASRARPMAVIVTSPRGTVAAHAAALEAGADLFLSAAEAANETILGAYVARLLRERRGRAEGILEDSSGDVERPASEAPRIAEAFALPTDPLRSESGRLDATRIAELANVPLRRLAAAIGVKYGTLHKTPDAPAVQTALAPFANVLAMLNQVYGGDARRLRAWLETPQAALGERPPREVLLEPGGVQGVEQFITGAWLGEPE